MSKIYYIDPTNGNNNNNGLSPATAIKNFWDAKVEFGDSKEPSIFYVKRGEDLILPASKNIELPFGIIMSWPSSQESPYYENRPDSGKVWDNEELPRANFYGADKSVLSLPSKVGNKVKFKNIDIIFKEKRTSNSFVQLKNSTIDFVDCKIDVPADKWVKRDTDTGFVRFLEESSEIEIDNHFSLKNCNVDATNTYLVVTQTANIKYNRNIVFEDSAINIYNLMYSDNLYSSNKLTLNLKNNSIKTKDKMIFTPRDRQGNFNIIAINNKFMFSNGFIALTSHGDDYIVGRLSLKSSNNTYLSSDNHLIMATARAYYTTYVSIQTNGDYVEAKCFLSTYNRSRDYVTFKSRDTHYINLEYIISLNTENTTSDIFFENNKYTNTAFLIKNYGSVSNLNIFETNIFVKAIAVGSSDKANITNSYISLINSSTSSYLLNEKTLNTIVELKNCNVGCVKKGSAPIYKVTNSTIREISSSSAVSGGSGYFEQCKLINDSNALLDENTEMMEFYDCYVSGAINNSSKTFTNVKFFNLSLLNDFTAYLNIRKYLRTKVDPTYRVNGSEFTLLINKYNNNPAYVGNDEIFCKFSNNKPVLTMYFAAGKKITNVDDFNVYVLFKSNKGPETEKANIVIDKDSKWEGLEEDYNYFKATVDLSSYNIENNEKIIFNFSVHNPIINDYYLDTFIEQSEKSPEEEN